MTKRFVLTAVGAAALLVVFGGRLAVPALAQTVKAVLMRDTDNPDLHLVQTSGFIVLNGGTGSSTEGNYTVPAGYRLVIDSMSARVVAPAGQSAYVNVQTSGAGSGAANTELMMQAPIADGSGAYTAGTVMTKQVADAGTTPIVLVARLAPSGSTGTVNVFWRWTGHLVSLN